ncbi:MAG: lysylphosphatidylglycerol synthase transmembrane domain-containing protein [Patescibacteria group bacterium]|nr:lysylphosphatidylglycerol synthase transmembrane domain-containing protein [Patescibacteria group bacterium]MDD5715324.1 lysylphosphatidylglycerol synthase transmembrane domain-containing protein [Patescibacteria group bacterium]
MKKIIFFILSAILGIVLFIAVIAKVGISNIWDAFTYFSFAKWLVIVVLYAISFYVTMYRWQLVLQSQGFRVTMAKLFPSKIIGYTVDYLTPSPNVGGEAIRAYVLRKDANVRFSQGLASVVIDKMLDFSFGLPFLLFSIVYILIKFDLSIKIIAVLLFISLLFIFLMALFYYKTLQQKDFFGAILRFLQLHRLSFISKVMDKIAKFEQIIIDVFRKDRRMMYKGLFLSSIGGICTLTAMWLILVFMGLKASLLDVILITTLNIVTFLLPIPGSFGGTEAGQAVIFSMLGFPPEQGVVYTLIFRSIDLVKVTIGLLFLSHFGLKIGPMIFNQKASIGEAPGQPPAPVQ